MSDPKQVAAPSCDAFVHLPGLRDRVTPPERSSVRMTPEALASWDQRARQLGQPEDWRLSEQQIEDSRCTILGPACRTQDLWIYGYGSLMWDPGFHFVEVRQADLWGYQRRFSYRTVLGRGTPERPALTLSLEPADGWCRGLAFRIAADLADAESAILWRREMIRGGYCPTLLPVTTPQGDITALVFASNRAHQGYVGELPLDQAASIIAGAAGVLGTNRAYLEQLSAQLAALEIEDPYIRQLHARVQRFGAEDGTLD